MQLNRCFHQRVWNFFHTICSCIFYSRVKKCDLSHRACLQCVYYLGSQMPKHISIDNKKMLQDKIHYIPLLKYACRPYKNQKRRRENNHKLTCNDNNSSKYNQNTMFPVNVSVTPDFLCVQFIYIWIPCYHALAAWKVAFHWDYIHSHYWTFSVHQYNRKNRTQGFAP